MKRAIPAAWFFSFALAACASLPPNATDAAYRAGIHTELAAGYYAQGQYAIALEEVRKAQAVDPAYAPAFNILGLLRAALQEDLASEQAFLRALALMPSYSEAHNNFGLYLCKRGRAEDGLRHLRAALDNPLYATPQTALLNAGLCSLEQGNFTTAHTYLQQALQHKPGYAGALQALSELEARRGHWPQAQAHLQKLSETGPLDAKALWLGLRIERALGRHEAETAYAARLRARFPDALQTQWLLSGRFDQSGDLL